MAAHYFCAVSNFTSAWLDETPYQRRFEEQFKGLVVPCGALIEYRPAKPDRQKLAKMEPRSVPGLFLGWYIQPGGRWTGDYLVAPLDSFGGGGG